MLDATALTERRPRSIFGYPTLFRPFPKDIYFNNFCQNVANDANVLHSLPKYLILIACLKFIVWCLWEEIYGNCRYFLLACDAGQKNFAAPLRFDPANAKLVRS